MSSSGSYERFAAVHLVGRFEHAVYQTLAGAPAVVWSADDVAAAVNAEAALVDVVLRQFAAAGIAETIPDDMITSYRWRPTAEYLAEAPSPDTARDPVCGMWVSLATPFSVDADDATQYFCSRRCALRFERDHT